MLLTAMKEDVSMTTSPSDQAQEECNHIAESMIEEIHLLGIPEGRARHTAGRRHGGSLKRKLLRQIRQARRAAMIG